MPSFDYAAPTTISEAVSLMASADSGKTVRALAGGTDLIDQLKTNRRNADLVVDLKRIPELLRLESDADGLHIGAATCCSDVHHDPTVNSKYGGLADSTGLVGSVQIQNRAAVGGNVCNAAPSGDTTPNLLVHEAIAVITGPTGTRNVELTDFFVGPGQTVIQSSEFLQELIVPTPPEHSASAYLRFIPRNEMDIAVAGVASFLQIDPNTRTVQKARIALASVAPTPVRARTAESTLEGNIITAELIDSAGDAAIESATPITDVRGSAEYRRELVRVLTRRTLHICLDRIGISL
jgi:carbon-monoxide dehydrogenase medium subunit